MRPDVNAEAGGAEGREPPPWLATLAEAAAHLPVPAPLRPPAEGARASAVLVLFGEGGPVTTAGPDVLLIQRNNGLRRHAGQPAFPGGAVDPGDSGPVACALREAAEETGLDTTGVRVLTVLPELYINPSRFRVTPVLAWWHTPTEVWPADIAEVASVTRVSVAELTDPDNRVHVRGPSGLLFPAFQVRGMLVWGFTGWLLTELLRLGGWERPWITDSTRVVDVMPRT